MAFAVEFESPGRGPEESQRGSEGKGISIRKRPGKSSGRGFVTQAVCKALVSSARCIVLAGLLSTLGACGMSSLTSGMGSGWFGGKKTTAVDVDSVSKDKLLDAAKADSGTLTNISGSVAYGCPRFQVWARDGYVTVYEAGRIGDGLAVMHRGEITKTARECSIEPGRVTVKYGFSGRVLLGQKGNSGRVSLPVNIFVTDAKRQKIATEKARVDVDVALDDPIGYFSLVRQLSFDIPEGSRPGEYEVYVGFDRTIPGAG